MNFFETLIRPDREEHPERAEVARAANLLQVGEFQLLQLAFFDWFGREMPDGECDRLFSSYMLHDIVPHWARRYARKIIGLDAAGVLDDLDPVFHRYDPEYRTWIPDGARKFCSAALVITICVGGGIWISHAITEPTSQILPPYFTDKEMQQSKRGPNPAP